MHMEEMYRVIELVKPYIDVLDVSTGGAVPTPSLSGENCRVVKTEIWSVYGCRWSDYGPASGGGNPRWRTGGPGSFGPGTSA